MPKRKIKVFISYAHKDSEYFEVFSEGLKNSLYTSDKFDFGAWEDSDIQVASFWDDTIKKHLSTSDIAILCVSSNFLNSRYIAANEFGLLIKEYPDTLIIPVYFNHCNINAWDELSKRQFFKPTGDRYDEATTSDFVFCDLVDFNKKDGGLIPNPNIELYLQDLVTKIEIALLQPGQAEGGIAPPPPPPLPPTPTKITGDKIVYYFEIACMIAAFIAAIFFLFKDSDTALVKSASCAICSLLFLIVFTATKSKLKLN